MNRIILVTLALLFASVGWAHNVNSKTTNGTQSVQEVKIEFMVGPSDVDFPAGYSVIATRYATIPPGQTVSYDFSWDEYDDTTYTIVTSRNQYDSSLVGNSYVGGTGGLQIVNGSPWDGNTTSDVSTTYTLGPGRIPNPDAAKTVWLTEDDTLTANLFREGVDKIVAFTQPSTNSSMTGGTGGAEEDYVNAHQRSNEEGRSDVTNAALTEGATAGAAAAALFTSTVPAPTELGFSVPDGGGMPSIFDVTEPFTGKTYHFNPFTSERLGPVFDWFRVALAWLAIVLLGIYVFRHSQEFAIAIGMVQQAKGNPVAGGTGAQATAAIAATLMTVAIVAFVTALLGWSFGDITLPTILGTAHDGPFSGVPTGVAWMLNQTFPVSTILACVVARLSFHLYGMPLYMTMVTVVRFIVP